MPRLNRLVPLSIALRFPWPHADIYARYFLGAAYPLATSFTTVSTAVQKQPNGPSGDDPAGINKASKD